MFQAYGDSGGATLRAFALALVMLIGLWFVLPHSLSASRDSSGEGMDGGAVTRCADEKKRAKGLADACGLTGRETEVLELLVRGYNNGYIREKLCISRNTANTHVRHIYEKTGIHSKQELIEAYNGQFPSGASGLGERPR